MNVERLATILLKRALVENFGTERGDRVAGALGLLEVKGAVTYGGWKPHQGDWYRVKGRSEKHQRVYEVFDGSCQCADHYYRGETVACAHREAIRAFTKAQKLLPHYNAFKAEGVELSL